MTKIVSRSPIGLIIQLKFYKDFLVVSDSQEQVHGCIICSTQTNANSSKHNLIKKETITPQTNLSRT